MVGSSPWLFAATHVLHRCQVPRHPPLALYSLEEQRCSYSLCSSQGARSQTRGCRPELSSCRQRLVYTSRQFEGSFPQSRREDSRPNREPHREANLHLRPIALSDTDRASLQLGSHSHGVWKHRLLRKEVIQPHLPVRLPCYDFTPIADPTFDGSPHKGWATGFGCYRLSWCDGRCVQGPGTYSPRRC